MKKPRRTFAKLIKALSALSDSDRLKIMKEAEDMAKTKTSITASGSMDLYAGSEDKSTLMSHFNIRMP